MCQQVVSAKKLAPKLNIVLENYFFPTKKMVAMNEKNIVLIIILYGKKKICKTDSTSCDTSDIVCRDIQNWYYCFYQ